MAEDAHARKHEPRITPVSSITRRQGVVTELRRSIVLGAIKPGERLTESSLSRALGVSRPTVREALHQVSQEGLVVQEPYRGLRVADLDPPMLLDLARVRMALDLEAASEILADPTGGRLDWVIGAWERYLEVMDSPDPLAQHDAHMEFHRSIWEASENSVLMRLWPVTEAHMTIALARDQAAREDPERARAVHEAIIDAFHTGDLDNVRVALEAHTLQSAEELVRVLADETSDEARA